MQSPANAVIFPMQDVLGLGTRARMNRPGTLAGNWRWRLPPVKFGPLAQRLRLLTETFERNGLSQTAQE
jgi:4-alpha-glucanotransferase